MHRGSGLIGSYKEAIEWRTLRRKESNFILRQTLFSFHPCVSSEHMQILHLKFSRLDCSAPFLIFWLLFLVCWCIKYTWFHILLQSFFFQKKTILFLKMNPLLQKPTACINTAESKWSSSFPMPEAPGNTCNICFRKERIKWEWWRITFAVFSVVG